MENGITSRDFGRLEEKVDGLDRHVTETRAELSARIEDLKDDFSRSSTKQGERLGDLEAWKLTSNTTQRNMLAVWALLQAFLLTLFGGWIKNWF